MIFFQTELNFSTHRHYWETVRGAEVERSAGDVQIQVAIFWVRVQVKSQVSIMVQTERYYGHFLAISRNIRGNSLLRPGWKSIQPSLTASQSGKDPGMTSSPSRLMMIAEQPIRSPGRQYTADLSDEYMATAIMRQVYDGLERTNQRQGAHWLWLRWKE